VDAGAVESDEQRQDDNDVDRLPLPDRATVCRTVATLPLLVRSSHRAQMTA
jgi:hypothetical protein